MGVSDSCNVITSRQIAADPNVPGFLQTLAGRGIIPPAANDHWPARELSGGASQGVAVVVIEKEGG